MNCSMNVSLIILGTVLTLNAHTQQPKLNALGKQISPVLEKQVLSIAESNMNRRPVTVTAFYSKRSAGNRHDFFSEGDYWWPDSTNPEGPYIQKDGQTNPNNFVAHRLAMIGFSQLIGNLTSAFLITGNKKFAKAALPHLHAWFVDTATKMNPSLLYAQAIKGKVTGRGVGIIDMIQMMEVAQSIRVLEKAGLIPDRDITIMKKWFGDYLEWVTHYSYGLDEREAKNNHGTCWVMQVLSFSKLTKNDSLIKDCASRYQNILLPGQLAADGSFPLELKRTKPYGYSLFNLDAVTMVSYMLSQQNPAIFQFQLSNGSNLNKAIQFLAPYVKNKSIWPYPKDVMYWDQWPVAHPFLLFGFYGFKNQNWKTLWDSLDHFPNNGEVVRNLPVRNPLIWLTNLD